jgi:signal transduction histidine kinase
MNRYELESGELELLSGGGVTGARLRSHDWSSEPLGYPELWPPRLRAAVQLLLSAHTPLAIAWGGAMRTIHNDAFAAILHVSGLTGSVGEPLDTLFPELWQRIESVVVRAMHGGGSAVLEDQLFCVYRNGHAEETYLSVSCDPIPESASRSEGVLISLTDSTSRVIGARRTAALRDAAAAGTTAHSVDEAARNVLDALAQHSSDLPFALLYALDADNPGHARLASAAGMMTGTSASPPTIMLGSVAEAASWPLSLTLASGGKIVLRDLRRFDPLPAGDWPLAARSAVAVPLTSTANGPADAVFVAGVSARRELDAAYLDFIELVASHVTAALAVGRRREDEERHAVAHAAAKAARARRRARVRALEARLTGMLEERTRLAREIHDGLLQGITGIALQLRATIPHVISSPETAHATLEQIAALAEHASREARQAVWDIRRPLLGGRDFVQAVESAAQRAIEGAPLTLRVRTRGRVQRLVPAAQGAVLGVVREAVTNAVRHAEATTIQITLTYDAERTHAIVHDDGRGFDIAPEPGAYAGHFGLVGMRERAHQAGGTLRVRSTPGQGTRVALVLPSSQKTPGG